jgi:uncharacterized protein
MLTACTDTTPRLHVSRRFASGHLLRCSLGEVAPVGVRRMPTARHDGQMAERDRDEARRPRSARQRDSFGRPLSRGIESIARIPDDLTLPLAESLTYADDLLDRDLAFNAHEVLEAAWTNGSDDERMMWQGLVQLAVGITHVQRGNVKGVLIVLRRAAARLAHEQSRYVDAVGWSTTPKRSSTTSRRVSRSHGSACATSGCPPTAVAVFRTALYFSSAFAQPARIERKLARRSRELAASITLPPARAGWV